MEMTLTQAITDYIEQTKISELEPLQKTLNKVLEKGDDVAIAKAKVEYTEAAMPIEERYKPVVWLTDAAKKSKNMRLATHTAKFTHSDAKASSVLVSDHNTENDSYLVTASLAEKDIDAFGSAGNLKVAKLFKLQVNGDSLLKQLQQGHASVLSDFTDQPDVLASWVEGFKLALVDENLTSHTLSKQLYFPLNARDNETEYHLLCPLFSSALAHQLHQKITGTRFAGTKEIRDARRAGKYHALMDQSFPNTAIQNFGGTQPQNISLFNTKAERGGKTYLLNTAPPSFQAQVKPPMMSDSIFDRQFTYKVSGYLREFKTFLMNLKPEENNFKIRYKRDHHFVLPILDQLMIYASNIQLMESGWSLAEDRKLKPQHALWLDVYCPNDAFQKEREKLNWLDVIAADFANWLIKQLKHEDKYLLGDVEHAYFSKLCLHHLKRFEQITPTLGEL